MATYNWAIRPGIDNKYGFGVADSADDVRPGNCCYVALFGNDITGNGSRMKPFKTILKASSVIGNVIVASGTYREKLEGGSTLLSDGDVVIDGEFVADKMSLPTTNHGAKFRGGFACENIYYVNYYYCDFDGVTPGRIDDAYLSMGRFRFNTVKRITIRIQQENYIIPSYRAIENNTFYNCNIYIPAINPAFKNVFNMCVFVNCNINFCGVDPTYMTYCLFHNCRFKNEDESVNKQLYPIIPPGFNNSITTIEELRSFLGTTEGLNKCVISDPKFNNPDIDDFSLAFDSPAKNLSYFGTYIGAHSIGYSIKASSDEATGGFDFSTAVNIDVAENSITMLNPSVLASIETKVFSNLIQRELGVAPIYGFNADRNGQYIDSIEDLADTTIAPGTNLLANTPYLVEIAAIVNDSQSVQPGERFTVGSVVTFTSAGGGVCREIKEAPQRHTILAKFADVEEDLAATPYQHYEPGIKFSSNNIGDSRTGAIVRGNGDPLYERGAGKEFPINARFMKFKYIIQPNNLKP